MGIELKPCPFCGGNAEFDHDDDRYQWIACQSCGISTDTGFDHDDDARIRIAEEWNRRTTEHEELVHRLRDAEKDAERYRWLRNSERLGNDDIDGQLIIGTAGGEDLLFEDQLDFVIDATMADQQHKKSGD